MKWIGQHIYDLVARFRNDVYLEDLSTTTETNVLVVDSDGKVSKNTTTIGDITGITEGDNITVLDPTGPVPKVDLNTTLTGLDSVTSTSFIGALTGNADTATKIASITNDNIVQLTGVQTLTFKTLFRPTIEGYATFPGDTSGGTYLKATAVAGSTTLTLPAATDTLVGKDTADTLTNKTLTSPVINSPTGLVKGDVGLGSVDDTADTAKPVSTAQQTALDLKANLASPTFTGKISLNDGGYSVFVGEEAGLNDDASANLSVGVGYQALYSNTTGSFNTAHGHAALYSNTTGIGNTASGGSALYNNTTGSFNTAVGLNAGKFIADGTTASVVNSSSVFLGYATKALGDSQTNQIVIGHSAVGLGSNTAILGNSSITKTKLQGNVDIGGDIELGHASDTTITRVSPGRIAVEGVNVVTTSSTDTLTNKTLTSPALSLPVIGGLGAGFNGSTSGVTHLQASAVAGTTFLTLPAAVDTLVGKATTDILTNKTLTAPTITGAGAIAGVFTGNITGNVTGNADTVTTNADLTGPVTSTGNTTAIASGAITTDMQKHLQTFEFNGYTVSAASTNYFIPAIINVPTGPFNHNVDAGADGLAALAPAALSRSGGKVMPYAGTCKLWKGWVAVTGTAAFKVGIFKYTPIAGILTSDSLVLVNEFSDIALNSGSKLIAISETSFDSGFAAGDILITGISCESGRTVFFTSTLEVEWD
jgi:hypothetical protein